MGYFDIIKRGFAVAHKNLWVILTQIISGVALAAVFFVCLAVLLTMAIGSLAGMSLENISAEDIGAIIQSSVAIIMALVFLVLLFVLLAALITSYVQAGNMGCMIDTAKGTAGGFTASNFFASARRSMLSLFALYLLWLLMSVGVFVAFGIVGGVGIWGLLLPLKDAGRQLIAFAVGVPFLVVLILAFLVTWFFFYAGYTFSVIVLVGERTGASHALGESYRFIKRHFWDALLFSLLVVVIAFAANMASQVVTLPFRLTTDSNPMLALAMLPLVIVASIFQMYVSLVARSAFIVYYLDRTAPPPPPVEPAAPEPAAPEGPVADTSPAEPAGPVAPDADGEPVEAELLEPEVVDEEEEGR